MDQNIPSAAQGAHSQAEEARPVAGKSMEIQQRHGEIIFQCQMEDGIR